MIFYFYNGLLNPVETDFWIVKYGIPIIFLELLSLFGYILSSGVIESRSTEGSPVFLFFLGLIIVFAFAISFLFNILLFFYFLISLIIKFFALRYSKNENDNNKSNKFDDLGASALSWLFSIFIGFFGSPILRDSYSEQINAIDEFIINNLSDGIQLTSSDIPGSSLGGLAALWGMSYFALLFLFNLLIIIYYRNKA